MTAPPAPATARYRGHPRAAVAVLVASWLMALAGAVLQLASGIPITPDVLFLVVDVVVGLVYGVVAAVILSRRGHPVAWLVSLTAVGGALAALGGGWAAFASTHATQGGAELRGWLFGSAWVPGTVGLFLVVPWLVRETPLTTVAWAGLALGAAVTLGLSVQRLVFPMVDNGWLLVLVAVVGLVTAGGVLWRYRRGPVAERPGLLLLAAGTALMALSFVPVVLVPYTSSDVVLLVPISHLACQALFPGALLVTMLRNRLWGIDLAVSRTVLFGLLTLGLLVVYAVLVWSASLAVGSSAVAQAVAAIGVVLAVDPLRRWLDQRVRRLVYGEATSPGRAALLIGASLSGGRSTELLDRLAAAVGEALRLESVTLRLAGAPGAEGHWAEGHWGAASSPPLEREVTQGQGPQPDVVGTLSLTPRPGERLDRRSLEALDRLEPVLAVGLGLVRATDEVVRARDAATRARLAERQVIRRELHDGVGPWMSGLRLGLQGARNVLRTDPEAADAVLAALQDEVAGRVEDVRLLSRSLLPPILEERGLGAALADLAARHAAGGFGVELVGLPVEEPGALAGLDPRVAAVAYAVASEAVLNAARHSGVRGCVLDVRIVEGGGGSAGRGDGGSARLVVTCRDDGSGRSPDAADGVGMRSMRERTSELGGAVSVSTGEAGRGTIVQATVPLDLEVAT